MFDRLVAVLERWLVTDVRYFIRGLSWLTFGQVVSSGATFIAALAFANLLAPETYGTYRYILAAYAVLAVPALGGINNALVQAVASRKEGGISDAFSTKLQFGLLGSLAAIAGSIYYLVQGNTVLSACFAIIAVTIPVMETFGLFDSILQGRQDFKRSVVIDSLLQVAVVVGIVSVVFFTQSPIAVVAAYFVLWSAGRAAAWWYVRTVLPKGGTDPDPRTIPFGWHLSLMGAGATVAQYVDQILLFQHVGSAELALYSIAVAIPEQFKNSFRNVFSLLLPRYSQQSDTSIRATIWHKAMLFSLVTVCMSIGYIVLIPWALPLFFPKYVGSIFYSQLFSLTFITAVSGIFLTALQAGHRTKQLYVYNVLHPLIQIVLAVIGVLTAGVLGALLSRLATRTIMCVVAIVLYHRAGSQT